jgi:hypothetical protein
VQRLANVASRIRPALVVVQEGAASCEKKQNRAAKEGHGAAQNCLPENGSPKIHHSRIQLTTLDARLCTSLLHVFRNKQLQSDLEEVAFTS